MGHPGEKRLTEETARQQPKTSDKHWEVHTFITATVLIIPNPWHMGKRSNDHPARTQTTERAKLNQAEQHRAGEDHAGSRIQPPQLGHVRTRGLCPYTGLRDAFLTNSTQQP